MELQSLFGCTFRANTFDCNFYFMYNILWSIWFLVEGERKVGAATYFFTVFANKVWMFIFMRLMSAASGT